MASTPGSLDLASKSSTSGLPLPEALFTLLTLAKGNQPQPRSRVPKYPLRRREKGALIAALSLICIALSLLALFDYIGPRLPLNDDWVYAWGVTHFSVTHFRIYPGSSAFALPQLAVAYLISGHSGDQRLLRLSVLPFAFLLGTSTYQVARSLDSNRFWSMAAVLGLISCPLFMSGSTTFMSDTPYLGLLSATVLLYVRWLKTGRGAVGLVAMTTVAASQRQVGVLLPVALETVLLVDYRARRVSEHLVALVAFVFSLAPVLVLWLLGALPPTQGGRIGAAQAVPLSDRLLAVGHLPAMIGMGLLPFGLAFLVGFGSRRFRRRRLELAACLILLQVGLGAYSLQRSIFPGNLLTPAGLGPLSLDGTKPAVFPSYIFLGFEAAAVLAAIGFLALNCEVLDPRRWPVAGRLLIVAAGLQFLPLLFTAYVPFDRYYLPVVVLLLPIAANLASRSRVALPALGYALLSTCGGIALYVVGQQDYFAWSVARDESAQLAYRLAPAGDVNAGYEENAVHVEVAIYDRTGVFIGGNAGAGQRQFTTAGPLHPRILLLYAAPGDPRPGYSYGSAAAGRIVLAFEP